MYLNVLSNSKYKCHNNKQIKAIGQLVLGFPSTNAYLPSPPRTRRITELHIPAQGDWLKVESFSLVHAKSFTEVLKSHCAFQR